MTWLIRDSQLHKPLTLLAVMGEERLMHAMPPESYTKFEKLEDAEAAVNRDKAPQYLEIVDCEFHEQSVARRTRKRPKPKPDPDDAEG